MREGGVIPPIHFLLPSTLLLPTGLLSYCLLIAISLRTLLLASLPGRVFSLGLQASPKGPF